jgi:hypothetical protein
MNQWFGSRDYVKYASAFCAGSEKPFLNYTKPFIRQAEAKDMD